jgi:hypothetical protein
MQLRIVHEYYSTDLTCRVGGLVVGTVLAKVDPRLYEPHMVNKSVVAKNNEQDLIL